MRVKLLLSGKTSDRFIRDGMKLYIDRIGHYVPFEVLEIAEGAILKNLKAGDYLVLLDEKGVELTSIEWARNLEHKTAHLSRDLVFAVGGPYGFSEEVYARCNEKLSLSKMTFSHQLVRLVFLEQLYRAMTIIKGEPYHHE